MVGFSRYGSGGRWVQVMDVHLRHEKAFTLAVAALVLLGLIVALGPRDRSVVGAGGASAEEPTTTTDGVVFTAPGELILVVDEPTPPPTQVPVTAGGTVSPTTSEASSDHQQSTTTVGSQSPSSAEPAAASGQPTSADPGAADPTTGESAPGGELALAQETEQVSGSIDGAGLLSGAPELTGMANAAPRIDPDTELAGLGTRDSSSVPWMLLIAANAGIAMVAVVILRLRR